MLSFRRQTTFSLCHACQCLQLHFKQSASTAQKELTRITIPQKLQLRLLKLHQKKAASEPGKRPTVFKSPLVIACKRNKFNHHRGQTYSDFGPTSLASYGWKHRKSAGDYFTLLCHNKNPALLSDSDKTFASLNLDNDILEAVSGLGHETPTKIQIAAIPSILQGTHTLCAAETGSGKTLAYLFPALHMLLRRKRVMEESKKILNAPSIVILVPSRELVGQINGVVQQLKKHIDVDVHSLCGGRGTRGRLAWPTRKQMDVIITTPGVLNRFLAAGQVKYSSLQQIILDEADTLFDDSFSDIVANILHRLKIPTITSEPNLHSPNSASRFNYGVQFILVSATMPRSLQDSLGNFVPIDAFHKVTTEGLHRLMPHVPQKFMRLLPSQKAEALLKLVKSHSSSPTIIFCKNSLTSFFVMHLLKNNGMDPAIINGEMQEQNRHGVFEKFQEGHYNILIATDLASRGLDTIKVQHIINYDFPNFVSDYIHRAGRVGRVGMQQSGMVTSFVAQKWEVDILWQIEIAARKSADLHNVNANIRRKLEGKYMKKHGFPTETI